MYLGVEGSKIDFEKEIFVKDAYDVHRLHELNCTKETRCLEKIHVRWKS